MKDSNVRYIVAVFYDEEVYILQTDEKVHFFFHHYPKVYKKAGYACNMANKLAETYLNDKVCVFKVKQEEELSYDEYKNWDKNEDRLVYEAKRKPIFEKK